MMNFKHKILIINLSQKVTLNPNLLVTKVLIDQLSFVLTEIISLRLIT